MAVRKSTMQQQVWEAVTQVNPADPMITTLYGVTGPSPWLVGQLGLLGQVFVDYYFATLTEQAVLFHAAAKVSNRPKELEVAVPRWQAAQAVSDVRLGAVWNSFRFQFPGEKSPTRINVHRAWRPELDQFLWALTGMPVSG